ncbi:MAG: (2Fe-2S)-binding protein [Anaerolineae bacterium]|nr:(2Fe-2S)-binding protein [Anaerolineae bacterium]
MPKVTVGDKSFEVPENTRLVLALEDNGVDVLHRCGGKARCTTCRVRFEAGEPEQMTQAEYDRLTRDADDNLYGNVRLACQIPVTHDMVVEPLMRLSASEYDGPGARPKDDIEPGPVFIDKP